MTQELAVASQEPLILAEHGIADWRKMLRYSTERYTSAEFARLEREKVFFRTWLLVGRASQAPNLGDFFLVDIAGQDIIVIRSEDNTFRAFYNVCTHRGRRLVDEPSGNARTLRCIYHAWSFDTCGELKSLPFEESFVDFNRDKLKLASVQCDVWSGLIFVNLDPKAESLESYMGPLNHCARDWFRADMVKAVNVIDYNANWKVVPENFAEFYHVPGLHAQRYTSFALDETAFALFRLHSIQAIPFVSRKGWSKTRKNDWRDWVGEHNPTNPSFMYHHLLFPSTTIHVNPHVGTVAFFQGMPHASDPNRCQFRYWKFLIGTKTPEAFVEEVFKQDLDNMEPHGRGLQSRGLKEHTLSMLECRVAHMHATLDAFIARP